MKSRHPSRPKGFTLIELLVVIVIIAALASVTFTVASRAMRNARATKDVSNLRQVGLLLNTKAAELGFFPTGTFPEEGKSWVDTLIQDEIGEGSSTTQMQVFWSPLYERNIPENLKQPAVTHYGANPLIMTEAQPGGDLPQWVVRPTQLMRPSEQILICGVSPKSENAPYHMGSPTVDGMLGNLGVEVTGDGTPPQSNPSDSEASAGLKLPLAKKQQYNALPDFFRYGTSKGQFLFADGHIQSMTPMEHKQKHWAISY